MKNIVFVDDERELLDGLRARLYKLVQSLVGVGAESCIAAPILGHAFGKPSA